MVGGCLKCLLGVGKSPDLAKASGDSPGRWSGVLGLESPGGPAAFGSGCAVVCVDRKGPDLGREVGCGGP